MCAGRMVRRRMTKPLSPEDVNKILGVPPWWWRFARAVQQYLIRRGVLAKELGMLHDPSSLTPHDR